MSPRRVVPHHPRLLIREAVDNRLRHDVRELAAGCRSALYGLSWTISSATMIFLRVDVEERAVGAAPRPGADRQRVGRLAPDRSARRRRGRSRSRRRECRPACPLPMWFENIMIDGHAAEQPLAVVFAAVQQHLAEAEVVGRRCRSGRRRRGSRSSARGTPACGAA